jgi:hypothetical protein
MIQQDFHHDQRLYNKCNFHCSIGLHLQTTGIFLLKRILSGHVLQELIHNRVVMFYEIR